MTFTPRQLLDGGHHFDDIGLPERYNRQRRYNQNSTTSGIALPRDRMHSFVVSIGLTQDRCHCPLDRTTVHISRKNNT